MLSDISLIFKNIIQNLFKIDILNNSVLHNTLITSSTAILLASPELYIMK